MPEEQLLEGRVLYDEEGNEVRIPISKEVPLDEISSRLTEAEELRKSKAQWQLEKAELEQSVNPNWKAVREREKRLQSALERKGVKVDAEGNPIDEQPMDIKRVRETAQQEIREQMIGEYLGESFDQFGDQRDAAQVYFDKLMTGEDRTLTNAKRIMKDVESVMGFGIKEQKAVYVSGRPPQISRKKENFANTERGQELARRLEINLDDK